MEASLQPLIISGVPAENSRLLNATIYLDAPAALRPLHYGTARLRTAPTNANASLQSLIIFDVRVKNSRLLNATT